MTTNERTAELIAKIYDEPLTIPRPYISLGFKPLELIGLVALLLVLVLPMSLPGIWTFGWPLVTYCSTVLVCLLVYAITTFLLARVGTQVDLSTIRKGLDASLKGVLDQYADGINFSDEEMERYVESRRRIHYKIANKRDSSKAVLARRR